MLLETLVTISLISVIMAAFTTFFVSAVASTSAQRATQTATVVANSAVERIRAMPSSDVVTGRGRTSVANQFNNASATVKPWLAAMDQASDIAVALLSGDNAAVPTRPVPQQVGSILYSVNAYIGSCVVLTGLTLAATCLPANPLTGVTYLRAVVAVTWTGARCPPTKCQYVTSTLLSAADDPLFNLNQTPPAAPVLLYPASNSVIWAVNDVVNLLPLTFTAVTPLPLAITGGALPAGITLNTATGLISNPQPLSAAPASGSVTLRLTDGFGRFTTTVLAWTVIPALTATAPSAQVTFIGVALAAPLTVTASSGTLGYTWSDPNGTLPPGLTLSTVANQASITGTPTTAGFVFPVPAPGKVFTVILNVMDSAGRQATVSFLWTIGYPPVLIAQPGPQASTIGTFKTLQLIAAVGTGSGAVGWTSTTMPAGLTLSSAGVISGTPTTLGTTSVTVTVTDSQITGSSDTKTFNWTVYAKPTVAALANYDLTVGMYAQFQLTTSCLNVPCTYVMNNGPATVTITNSGLLRGTITSTPQTFSAVTLTVTDSSGATGTSAAFWLRVNAPPLIANPGAQSTGFGNSVNFNMVPLVSGGSPTFTYSAVGLPTWLTLNTSTGVITGTSPAASATTAGIVVSLRDAYGFTASSPAFSWTVGALPSAPLGLGVVNGDTAVTLSWMAPATNNGGPVSGYTVTLSRGGGSCTTTGALTCAISKLTNGVVYSATVTATNSIGTGPPSAAVSAIPYPAILAANPDLTLWLDGADPNKLSVGADCTGVATASMPIGCWKDKSGQLPANNFTQATAPDQPSVGVWGNGLTAISFADPTDVLSSVKTDATYQTVFLVANVTNASGSNVIVNLFGQASQDFNVRIGSGTRRSNSTYSGPVSPFNNNDWSYDTGKPPLNWTNGAQGADAAQPISLITSDQALTAWSGQKASVSNTLNARGLVGQVGEVIAFRGILTNTQRRAVEEYLSNKWGIPILIPQALTTAQAPTSVTGVRQSANTATVSWSAPSADGVAPISNYTVTSSSNQTCTTTGTLTCQVGGLTRGTPYTFTVTATNAAGIGPTSVKSNSVTP